MSVRDEFTEDVKRVLAEVVVQFEISFPLRPNPPSAMLENGKGGTKVPDDEWIRTLADGRRVKFSCDQLTEITFITAQLEGNEVVYSVMLTKPEIPLSREEVEHRFKHELSKK